MIGEWASLAPNSDCMCLNHPPHLHSGILTPSGTINNPPSIQLIARLALAYAHAGAHIVAPSDMMDGRIHAIKQALREDGLEGCVSVMSYSAKFCSAWYGPFRDAAGSGVKVSEKRIDDLKSTRKIT